MKKNFFVFLLISCALTFGIANGAERGTQIAQKNNVPRKAINTIQIKQSPKTTVSRAATTRSAVQTQSKNNSITKPSAITTRTKKVTSRMATTPSPEIVNTFGSEYKTCHDAYFTCMDQFCANLDDTYRRCVCSSRLTEIKKKQSALSYAADSITGFHNLNLDVVNKSAAEVFAMTGASVGEQIATSSNDQSKSAKQLNTIGNLLSKPQNTLSLAEGGKMDIGGDISAIWSTTDIASGANIANLTGETLYNAVNAQCMKLVEPTCSSATTLNMVVSAYGMYIENDCSVLANDLAKKQRNANTSIHETERELHTARLDNYDTHNSLSINDCIQSIRQDITQNTACGNDFVHCLDTTGLYLNIDTGEPIYSKNFFNLGNQISLSDDILSNQTNRMIIHTLNSKKIFAQQSLDKCRDLSGDVWNEFMRQAIIEIYQNQQEKIRKVKTECLSTINQCYDTQKNQLKDFSDLNEKTLLGMRLEVTEELCREKLDTCSNLYGGGPDGLSELVSMMRNITDQQILSNCNEALMDFTQNVCGVQSNDTVHKYPYTCRVYTPGDQIYATNNACNNANDISACGSDYANSLYYRLVNYAMQVCIRPSEYQELNNNVPTQVLQIINMVMDQIRTKMNQELAQECEQFGGIWVPAKYTDQSIRLQTQFYTETGANTNWGYCKEPD